MFTLLANGILTWIKKTFSILLQKAFIFSLSVCNSRHESGSPENMQLKAD